ncbi:MAG: alginate export family protein [Nitrospinae bacterium]|nr:alginate export family protein [Nitrospinota bacterium]
MTRKLLSAAALMVAVFFTGSLVAQAAEVTFGGQLRPRLELWDESAAGVHTSFIDMRVRLNTKVKIDEKTSAFIQFQANQRFGSKSKDCTAFPCVTTLPGSRGSNVDNGNDTTADVGLHQAYFTIKKLFDQPVDLKLGRQEVVLDGHRLFGHTGWTMGAQSHDALRVTHSHDNMTISFIYSKVVENANKKIAGENFGGTDGDENSDQDFYILWANMKGLVGGNSSTSGILVFVDDDTLAANEDFYTIGVRHAGGAGNIDYRGEFYYQNGDSATGTSGDKSAFMVGLRAGLKMPAVNMKPKITLWFDYLSGNEATVVDDEQFDTLFDTGHKFYGFMDKFAGGQGNPKEGLMDLAVKAALKPTAKTVLKADLHFFIFAEDRGVGVGPGTGGGDGVGQELDVTWKYKYSPSTTFSVGASYFFADANFEPDDSNWVYTMIDLKF